MNLVPYIEALLYDKNFVILPGFGAFEQGSYLGVVINEEGEMQPPKRSIAFNPHLIAEDYVLAQAIANHQGIAVEEASQTLKQLVYNWKSSLNKGEEVLINGIGSFSKKNGLIQLNTEHTLMGTGHFGLPAIGVYTQKRSLKERVATESSSQAPPMSNPLSEVASPTIASQTTKKIEKNQPSEDIRAAVVLYRVAICTGVAAILSSLWYFWKQLNGVDLLSLFS